jgi:hypothetical protein
VTSSLKCTMRSLDMPRAEFLAADARREQPPNKAMKSDVEKRGSNFRCTVLASTFSGSATSAALFNAAYR